MLVLKVGIVGRTGAGKTSLSQAIFRLIEPTTGRIIVDGEDISMMGLHDCRSKVTVLPQVCILLCIFLSISISKYLTMFFFHQNLNYNIHVFVLYYNNNYPHDPNLIFKAAKFKYAKYSITFSRL